MPKKRPLALPIARSRPTLRWARGLLVGSLLILLLTGITSKVHADLPSPALDDLFPLGVQAGTSVTIEVSGSNLDGLSTLHVSEPSIQVEKIGDTKFRFTVAADVPPGVYDVSAVGKYGISAPRLFFVSRRTEVVEPEGDDTPVEMAVGSIVNGRIDKGGQIDRYRFTLHAGDRIVIDCHAERLDSKLRAVLELFDSTGKRLAANRGDLGIDPQIDFRVPADGMYLVTLTGLTFTGSKQHTYRLSIDAGPRIDFALPAVLRRGTTNRVTLFGRNLLPNSKVIAQTDSRANSGDQGLATPSDSDQEGFDRLEVDIPVPADYVATKLPARLAPAQAALDWFAYDHPETDEPVLFSLTDRSVRVDAGANHAPADAQPIELPCEVSGQLSAGDEQDWFSLEADRGDVIWLEAFGERIGSPVDLDLVVLDESGTLELLRLSDELANAGGTKFPTSHLDPAGRWVVPADGRYLLMLRNLRGDLRNDPRRVYRLSVRREEQDFQLAVVPRRADQNTGLNVWRGGRALAEVVAFRRLGMSGPIRVTAENLPPGIECPDVWLGPGVDRAPLVITARQDAVFSSGVLSLVGRADLGTHELVRPVKGGTSVASRTPVPKGRLAVEITVGPGPETPLRVTANPLFAKVPQGGFVEVQVVLERRHPSPSAVTELSAVLLPPGVPNGLAKIDAGKTEGWISFDLPGSLRPGRYTFAIQASTEVLMDGDKKQAIVAISNPITIEVYPAPFLLTVDPHTPLKIARGEIIQLNYSAQRRNGFIGKIHTDLRATGGLVGLRGRGVTFVGGTSSGTIQIIASDDAPLGPVKLLHLDALGTVEDEPIYRSGCFVYLEITPKKKQTESESQ